MKHFPKILITFNVMLMVCNIGLLILFYSDNKSEPSALLAKPSESLGKSSARESALAVDEEKSALERQQKVDSALTKLSTRKENATRQPKQAEDASLMLSEIKASINNTTSSSINERSDSSDGTEVASALIVSAANDRQTQAALEAKAQQEYQRRAADYRRSINTN